MLYVVIELWSYVYHGKHLALVKKQTENNIIYRRARAV